MNHLAKQFAAQSAIESILEFQRGLLSKKAAMIDSAEAFLSKLPEDVLGTIAFSEDWIQFCSPTREQVEAILSVLNAGRWEKSVTHDDATKIDYEGVVNGVKIVIHRSEPPKSCHIVETEIDVPAHKAIKRELVCH